MVGYFYGNALTALDFHLIIYFCFLPLLTIYIVANNNIYCSALNCSIARKSAEIWWCHVSSSLMKLISIAKRSVGNASKKPIKKTTNKWNCVRIFFYCLFIRSVLNICWHECGNAFQHFSRLKVKKKMNHYQFVSLRMTFCPKIEVEDKFANKATFPCWRCFECRDNFNFQFH